MYAKQQMFTESLLGDHPVPGGSSMLPSKAGCRPLLSGEQNEPGTIREQMDPDPGEGRPSSAAVRAVGDSEESPLWGCNFELGMHFTDFKEVGDNSLEVTRANLGPAQGLGPQQQAAGSMSPPWTRPKTLLMTQMS